MPLTTISTVLTSVKAATEIAKLIKSSTTTLEEAELKLKFADLISTLADVKIEISEIQEILISKDEEIRNLKNEQKIKEAMEYDGRYYWMLKDGEKDGPYCQRCYDADNKLIRLKHNKAKTYMNGDFTSESHRCRECNSAYYID